MSAETDSVPDAFRDFISELNIPENPSAETFSEDDQNSPEQPKRKEYLNKIPLDHDTCNKILKTVQNSIDPLIKQIGKDGFDTELPQYQYTFDGIENETEIEVSQKVEDNGKSIVLKKTDKASKTPLSSLTLVASTDGSTLIFSYKDKNLGELIISTLNKGEISGSFYTDDKSQDTAKIIENLDTDLRYSMQPKNAKSVDTKALSELVKGIKGTDDIRQSPTNADSPIPEDDDLIATVNRTHPNLPNQEQLETTYSIEYQDIEEFLQQLYSNPKTFGTIQESPAGEMMLFYTEQGVPVRYKNINKQDQETLLVFIQTPIPGYNAVLSLASTTASTNFKYSIALESEKINFYGLNIDWSYPDSSGRVSAIKLNEPTTEEHQQALNYVKDIIQQKPANKVQSFFYRIRDGIRAVKNS